MTKRLRELESAVAQLQATVDGLREELVDANERIRALEQEHEQEGSEESDPVPLGLLDEDADEAATADEAAPVEDIIIA